VISVATNFFQVCAGNSFSLPLTAVKRINEGRPCREQGSAAFRAVLIHTYGLSRMSRALSASSESSGGLSPAQRISTVVAGDCQTRNGRSIRRDRFRDSVLWSDCPLRHPNVAIIAKVLSRTPEKVLVMDFRQKMQQQTLRRISLQIAVPAQGVTFELQYSIVWRETRVLFAVPSNLLC
jgi:hypothetical protein